MLLPDKNKQYSGVLAFAGGKILGRN